MQSAPRPTTPRQRAPRGPLASTPSWGELGAFAAQALREGTLPLRHLAGLTDEEMRAIADVAEELRRSGELEEAASLYGLLIAYEPLQAEYWRAVAGLQQRLGQHALAVACFEVLALLADRDRGATRSEARSLTQLGQPELANALVQWADSPPSESVAAEPKGGPNGHVRCGAGQRAEGGAHG